MSVNSNLPLLNHPIEEPSVFTPVGLIDDVRRSRGIPDGELPAVCILDFDGDLCDWLSGQGLAKPVPSWPCFHTTMYAIQFEGGSCGLIPRTIGGPYAVLIAEQLAAAGVKVILGLTSAGRVSPDLPVPCLVVTTAAIRDEGTSLHYLPAGRQVHCPAPIAPFLTSELARTKWPVRCGTVWTTDAPYRETQSQLEAWAQESVLAVEMQAASLFAFGTARAVAVGLVAIVSNAVDHAGQQFDTGTQDDGLRILQACFRAARAFLEATAIRHQAT
ncbi:MAG: nucleoside phosphorylase [Bryobacterales bacterium]|nr:nucleoside phosphorylase [Bryobacterales bacterium]